MKNATTISQSINWNHRFTCWHTIADFMKGAALVLIARSDL